MKRVNDSLQIRIQCSFLTSKLKDDCISIILSCNEHGESWFMNYDIAKISPEVEAPSPMLRAELRRAAATPAAFREQLDGSDKRVAYLNIYECAPFGTSPRH